MHLFYLFRVFGRSICFLSPLLCLIGLLALHLIVLLRLRKRETKVISSISDKATGRTLFVSDANFFFMFLKSDFYFLCLLEHKLNNFYVVKFSCLFLNHADSMC